jgi:prepilin signal peptidase PulO-like enzyme (type II secretory pathway)
MGMPVPALELKMRAFLEQAMYARPRSKELFIGHPAFLLAAMAWYKKWPTVLLFVLVMGATIGQGSMVETFAHMRTPIYMSFMRGLGGLVLGAVLGVVCMLAIQFWQRIMSSIGGSKAEHE